MSGRVVGFAARLVKDIFPGGDGSSPADFVEIGGVVFFEAPGFEPWILPFPTARPELVHVPAGGLVGVRSR